ncbi:selenoprotein, putative [Plasmodium malariae]|uniref:Selenoprotein, putative n=1 Tax=Plasmodium malariae TaxID=5858 RepID=A0A1C3KFZ6_PLAMA|nr:selenoprotein, putative [Plasmodium malariae]
MNNKGKNQNDEEYENILKDRKLKYEKIRKKNVFHNRFTLPIINLINYITNFLKTIINITLFGLSNDSNVFNGKNNGSDDSFDKKKKMGNLGKSRIMELKNLGTCLGST